ncbi:tripartite tricarboxylate transporter substrate binding protein [Cupriavidus sp. AU9028]|uniref:Bug family tripartite tricarboxylate transporter substrate binding protein n=1 Tax=Cupriavidus sp. AU9028 TaxID=2871157 RepID=UPI001C97B4CB|nr:tripartite tricarboxylate transporter substrate binding protein [Cupriavidus sp. AU9028]MBY4897199.1 tripartite tricarboxylate transporter substrate binding protein [Cupriavidus sp. AU9028]
MNRRNLLRHAIAVAASCTVLAAPLAALADNGAAGFPSKPITFVVPYPAGGVADQFARAFAQALGERLGQSVVIDNRAGANGNIGSTFVARQQPADGYTLLLGSTSTLAINPHLYSSMGYDPLKDLQPITLTHQMPNVLVVGAQTPYKTVADVVAAAKAKPGTIDYGSAGNGNTMHLAGVLFEKHSGTRLVHVPYKGGPPALMDVLSGQIPMMFNNLPAVVTYKQANKLRVLAVADSKRSPVLPDVPTFAEAGVPDVVSNVWNGILVRRGTPEAIVQKLNKEMVAVLQSPKFRQPLEQQGYEVLSSSPAQFEALLKKDFGAMGKLAREAGIKLD